MSTEQAREQMIRELNIKTRTNGEAVELFELANEDVYDTDEILTDGRRDGGESLVMSRSRRGTEG